MFIVPRVALMPIPISIYTLRCQHALMLIPVSALASCVDRFHNVR